MSILATPPPRLRDKPAAIEPPGGWGPGKKSNAGDGPANRDDRAVNNALQGLDIAATVVVALLVVGSWAVAGFYLVPDYAGVVMLLGMVSTAGGLLYWRGRKVASEHAYLRNLPVPLDVERYLDLLGTFHGAERRVRVVVWFSDAPPDELHERWESRAATVGIKEVTWGADGQCVCLTSNPVTLRLQQQHDDLANNRPIHSHVRSVLDSVAIPLASQAKLHAVEVVVL